MSASLFSYVAGFFSIAEAFDVDVANANVGTFGAIFDDVTGFEGGAFVVAEARFKVPGIAPADVIGSEGVFVAAVPLLNAPEFVLDDVTGCDAVVADAELLLKAVPTFGLVDATTLTGTWGRPFNDPDLKRTILLQ